MNIKILIAADHAGLELKNKLINEFPQDTFNDLGTNSYKSVDYTDYANELAKRVSLDNNLKGVLICGTGVGMSIAANKYNNVRAGLAFNNDVAKLIREHNDANILILPGRFMDVFEAKRCIDNFVSASFEGGRHLRRINKIIDK